MNVKDLLLKFRGNLSHQVVDFKFLKIKITNLDFKLIFSNSLSVNFDSKKVV